MVGISKLQKTRNQHVTEICFGNIDRVDRREACARVCDFACILVGISTL